MTPSNDRHLRDALINAPPAVFDYPDGQPLEDLLQAISAVELALGAYAAGAVLLALGNELRYGGPR